jgi:hypothetical protein
VEFSTRGGVTLDDRKLWRAYKLYINFSGSRLYNNGGQPALTRLDSTRLDSTHSQTKLFYLQYSTSTTTTALYCTPVLLELVELVVLYVAVGFKLSTFYPWGRHNNIIGLDCSSLGDAVTVHKFR